MGQLKYPLDSSDKQIIKDVMRENMSDLIFDAVWNNLFYRLFQFDSLDGWNKVETTPGNIDLAGATAADGGYYLVVSTDATNNDLSNLYKMQFASGNGTTLSFKKRSRLRVEVSMGDVSNVIAEIYHGRTVTLGESNGEIYGFKVEDGILYGVAASLITGTLVEVSVNLGSFSINTDYILEARLFPNEKVVFLVNGVERGATNNVPIEVHYGLIDILVTAKENVTKGLNVNYMELIQAK